MSNNLSLLVDMLRQNEEALRELARVLQAERQCIVGLDTEGLAEAGRCRQQHEARIGLLAAECRFLVGEAARERSDAVVQTTTELAALLADNEAASLLEARDRLVRASAAVEGLNSINRGLVSHSLDMVKRSMALFGKFMNGCQTYGSAGQLAEGQGAACLVCGEI